MRTFKSKRFALFTLTSLLFVSFCLIPCGGFKVRDAEAGVHHGSGLKAAGNVMADMESHSCYNGGHVAAITGADADTCLHCVVSVSAVPHETRSLNLGALGFYMGGGLEDTHFYPYVAAFSEFDLPPPKFNKPIYILNSTYLI